MITTTFFIGIFLSYGVLTLVLVGGWVRLRKTSAAGTKKQHLISVIIPFRNEAKVIPGLLNDLEMQSLSPKDFEVILVDDHSDDQSLVVAEKSALQNVKIIRLPETITGKKAALDAGIQQAKGTIIATTDADVRVPSRWLSIVNDHFQHDHIKMVVGAVRIDPGASLFSRMQALEFSSLIGTAGAMLAMNTPTMCNGANLAFLKSAYQEVNGYEGNEHIPSGDDEFLMRKMAARWNRSVYFLYDADAVVTTSAQESFSKFIHQRLRWAGKWRYNSSFFTKAVAVTVLGFHVSFLLLLAFVLAGQVPLLTAVLLWSFKMFAELLFLFPVSSFLRLRWHWISFFALQLLHPVYVVSVGVLSQVRGYQWKGRSWSSSKP